MAAAHMAVGHKAVVHMGHHHTVAGIHILAGRTCEIQFRVIIRSKETGMVKTNTTNARSLAWVSCVATGEASCETKLQFGHRREGSGLIRLGKNKSLWVMCA